MALARNLGRPAVFSDLETLPPTWRGEIIDAALDLAAWWQDMPAADDEP